MTCPKITTGEARGLAFWAANKAGEDTDGLQNISVSPDNCEIHVEAQNPWPWPDSTYRLVRTANAWELERKINYIWGGTGGCYGDPYDETPSYMDEGVSIPACSDWYYEQTKPFIKEEKEYVGDNGYRIVADDKVAAETREFYFGVLEDKITEVSSFFGIENPHSDLATLFIFDGAVNPGPGLCVHFPACATGAGVFLKLASEMEFISFNEQAKQGRIYAEPIFVHEVGHFVRTDIADFFASGLEEGLAEYAEHYLVNKKIVPEDVAALVFAEYLGFGTEQRLNDEVSDYIEKIVLSASPDGGLEITFSLKKYVKEMPMYENITQTISFEWTTFHVLFDTLIQFIDQSSNGYYLKIFKRTAKDGLYSDTRSDMIACLDDGFVTYGEIAIDEGFAQVNNRYEAYVPLGVIWPVKDGRLPYYHTSFCFWDILRERFGHEVVASMVQSMVEFSKLHADIHDYVPFPFFDTFVELTGMEGSDASAYFDRFGVSIVDDDFLIGQYCE